jgi:hypothetical protein
MVCPLRICVVYPTGNRSRAHGRGVAPLGHAVAGPMVWVETGTQQSGWMLPNFSPSLLPQPNGGPDLSQKLSSPHRAQGLASCHSKPVTAYGPRLSVPRSCCDGPRSGHRPLYALRGGLSGAGANSTDSSIAANIERGF